MAGRDMWASTGAAKERTGKHHRALAGVKMHVRTAVLDWRTRKLEVLAEE